MINISWNDSFRCFTQSFWGGTILASVFEITFIFLFAIIYLICNYHKFIHGYENELETEGKSEAGILFENLKKHMVLDVGNGLTHVLLFVIAFLIAGMIEEFVKGIEISKGFDKSI